MTVDDQKRIAGEAAAQLVESGMIVGMGTGSTASWFVKALAARGLDIKGVPTSIATADLARSLGIPVLDLDDVRAIDLTVDGADEIGPGLSLIKGAGAAMLREKLVWEASARCVVIAEATKPVEVLGGIYPVPIEVVAFGHTHSANRIADVAADFGFPPARLRKKDGEVVRTDGGNLIYDLACGRIEAAAALGEALKTVTGVVEHGLFLDLADVALIGTDSGVLTLHP